MVVIKTAAVICYFVYRIRVFLKDRQGCTAFSSISSARDSIMELFHRNDHAEFGVNRRQGRSYTENSNSALVDSILKQYICLYKPII